MIQAGQGQSRSTLAGGFAGANQPLHDSLLPGFWAGIRAIVECFDQGKIATLAGVPEPTEDCRLGRWPVRGRDSLEPIPKPPHPQPFSSKGEKGAEYWNRLLVGRLSERSHRTTRLGESKGQSSKS